MVLRYSIKFPNDLKASDSSLKNLEIIDYVIKYDKGYPFISNDIIQKLFTKDGTYPIDKYIYNNDLMKSIISKVDIELLIISLIIAQTG